MSERDFLELLRQFPWEPAWLLALLVALIYGTIFRILLGKRKRGLLFYWAVAIVVMLVAQWLFSRAPLTEWSLGNLRIVEASALTWITLFVVNAFKV